MKRLPWLLMAWVGSLAAAPIAWWLVGDLSESMSLERALTAPEWLVDNTRLFGIYGLVALVSIAAIEFVGIRLHQIGRHTLAAYLPLVAAAVVGAVGYRVMTSFSHDTTLRASIAALLGVPVMFALAAIHVGWLRADMKRIRGY